MTKTGREVPAEIRASNFVNLEGRNVIVATIHDIRSRIASEVKLRQSSKMAALGILVAGIAHDFNNILGGITGYTELALMQTSNSDKQLRYLDGIDKGAKRATDLTRQLLSFARNHDNAGSLEELNVAGLISDVLELLAPTFQKNIIVDVSSVDLGCVVNAVPSLLHQVVLNLCTNAEHAMRGKGGVLKVSAEDVLPNDDFFQRHKGISSEPFVVITVEDAGYGIESDVKESIFDPFFSTKDAQEGVGLGLSVVHGIVEDHRGVIEVESRVGKGSLFSVFLPVGVCGPQQNLALQESAHLGCTGTLLVVDDESGLVEIYKSAMEHFGYSVVATDDPQQALEYVKLEPNRFDVLITDRTMPGMTGDELIKSVLAINSNLATILCSGYIVGPLDGQIAAPRIDAFLLKPVSMKELAKTIEKVLN